MFILAICALRVDYVDLTARMTGTTTTDDVRLSCAKLMSASMHIALYEYICTTVYDHNSHPVSTTPTTTTLLKCVGLGIML